MAGCHSQKDRPTSSTCGKFWTPKKAIAAGKSCESKKEVSCPLKKKMVMFRKGGEVFTGKGCITLLSWFKG